MDARPGSIDPEILLRESAWVYALARSLVGDASLADDVVQETWLAALRRPPQARGRGQIRAFLATIARRVAGSNLRAEANRRARECAASREEAVAPNSDALERLAVQRQLADALLGLREPYRTAVVLRYVEGLAPRDIAVRLDLSPQAVRTRISRGLHLLRERLDRDNDGDRGAWSAVLAGLAHRGTVASVPAGVAGGILVGMKLFLAAAATVVVTATLWTWLRTNHQGGPKSLAGVAPETRVDKEVAGASSDPELAAAPAVDPRAALATPTEKRTALHGRVVSALDRRPIAGAQIELPRVGADGGAAPADKKRELEGAIGRKDSAAAEKLAKQLDESPYESLRENGARSILATSGEDGRFELESSADGNRSLLVTARDHVATLVTDKALAADEEIEIALAPAGTFDVDVVDSAGAAFAGTWLSVGLSGKPANRPLFEGRPDGRGYGPSDVSGRVSIGELPLGVELVVDLVPQPGQRFRATPQTAAIDPQERRTHLTMRIESTGALRGAVRSAPVDDITLQARYSVLGSAAKPVSATVADDGTFAFERLPAGSGTLEVTTIRRGERATSSSTEPLPVEIVAGETTDVGVIDVPTPARLGGHVADWRDASGGYFVELRFLRGGRALARTSLDDAGRFEAWLPAGDCVIEVVHESRVLAAIAARVPTDDLELDLLAWCAALHGRVSATLGEKSMLFPHLTPSDPSSPGWSPSPKPQHGPFMIKDGSFRALPLEPGRYSLLVPLGAAGAAWIPRIELARGRDTDLGELSVGFGSVHGRVVGADRGPAADVEVILATPFERVLTTHASRRAVTDERGEFEFQGVPAGPWQVSASATDGALGSSPLADVFPNASADVEVALTVGARLSVRISNRGEPLPGVELALSPLDGPSPAFVDHSDAAGRIERAGLLAGRWRWSLGGKSVVRAGTVALRAGESRALDIDLGAAGVIFRVATSTQPAPWVSEVVAWSLDPATAGEMRRAKANRGASFELDVEPGRYLFVMQVRGDVARGVAALQQRTALVDVAAGVHAIDVAVSDVALELHRDDAARNASPPRALLVGLDGLSTVSWDITFPSSAIEGQLHYASLPAGSSVRLEGALASGSPIERIVTVPSTGTFVVDWR